MESAGGTYGPVTNIYFVSFHGQGLPNPSLLIHAPGMAGCHPCNTSLRDFCPLEACYISYELPSSRPASISFRDIRWVLTIPNYSQNYQPANLSQKPELLNELCYVMLCLVDS